MSAPIEVFVSYAEADGPFCIELDKHLSQLKRAGLIAVFHKRQVIAGTDWTKVLDQHLGTASIILLLQRGLEQGRNNCFMTRNGQKNHDRHTSPF
jgi:hypothetical protein